MAPATKPGVQAAFVPGTHEAWAPARSPALEKPPQTARAGTRITTVSDEANELVARARAGDKSAFREIFARHHADVARLVYRMMGPTPDLEDIVQEVFLQVFRSLKDFRGDAKLSTWLHRVTVNVVLMTRRAARSRPVLVAEPEQDVSASAGALPDEEAERRERARAFQRCLSQLSDKKRTVFVLHELEGLPSAEIAAIVECPVLTVRTRLFYARRELAELLKAEPSLKAFAAHLEGAGGSDEMMGRPSRHSHEPS